MARNTSGAVGALSHFQMYHRRFIPPLAVMAAALTFSSIGHAQRMQPIMGVAVDADTGAPVKGAVVVAFDTDGRQLRGTLTDRDGHFRLEIDPATYVRVTAERLGYTTWSISSDSIPDPGGSIVISLAPKPVALPSIVASGQSVCETDPVDGAATYALWSAARTSLRAALVSEAEGVILFRVATWFREVRRDGTVLHEQERIERVATRHPFITREPERLAAEGWVVFDGTEYVFFGPDAGALLSDAFLDTHCFRPAMSSSEHPGLVGLSFEPVPRRIMPDIAGTFWMNPDSGELRLVEFRYVDEGRSFRLGGEGEIHFQVLDSGAWVVERWAIRTPISSEWRPERITSPIQQFNELFEAGGELLEVLADWP